MPISGFFITIPMSFAETNWIKSIQAKYRSEYKLPGLLARAHLETPSPLEAVS